MPSVPRDLEVLLPSLGRAVAAGIEEAVQDGEKDRPFHGEAPSSRGDLALYHLIDSQLLPQSLEDKGGTDGQGAVRLDAALRGGHR